MDDHITTAEAARRLRVTPQAVSLMVKRGELIPVLKLPGVRGAFLFASSDVAEREPSPP